MSENIECDVAVAKITDVKTDERSVTVVLTGTKTIVHNDNGWDIEDIVDIKITLKCGMMRTLKQLGVAEFLNTKILDLRDRDATLQSFEEQKPVSAEMHQSMV